MKLLKRVLITFFATIILADFLLTFATIPKVWAAAEDVLVSDNFSDGDLDGWTILHGNWYINPQGNLAGSNSGVMLGGKINTGNSEWDNYRIDLDMNGFQGIDGGVGFRYTPNGNSYELDLRFGTGLYNTPEAILRKTEDGVTTIIGDTHSLTLIDDKWYHLTIEVSNANIKIWINNGLIFDITDTGTKVKKGTLTLSYWTGDIGVAYMKFDNVVVTALASPPPPKTPVIFIPGIGGSELKASQDIIWEQPDGHGGIFPFKHAYGANEKIWVNQDEATKLGDDDYFDVLRLKADGVTSEADLSLTGNLTPFGYTDIDSFFTGMGYEKNKNFFVFTYDWRKDVRSNKDSLDALIETVKTASGQTKVNLVVHSMGGLIARYYISDSSKASKVNKLIELGVPHLGTTESLKILMYGSWLGYDFKLFTIGIPPSETKDVAQNLSSVFELMPSLKYYDFYNGSIDLPYPFRDDRDIDNDKVTGDLNYSQIKNLLSNQSYNMTVFGIGEQFHNSLDSILNQTNGAKIYEIVGTAQPTLGQIHETWWITWPVNLISKTDEIYINGDDTVPLYSASLKNDNLDLSGATRIYYVEQRHSDLVSSSGTAMQTVKSILNDDNALPVEIKDQKITLDGEQLSLDDGELDLYDEDGKHTGIKDDGEIETNIPETFYTTSGKTKHAFVKKKASKVKVKVTKKKPATTSKTTNLKKRTYKADKISKTVIFKDISISDKGKIEFNLNPKADTSPSLIFYPDETKTDNTIINPTAEATGSAALDQTPPITSIQISGTKNSSGVYNGPATITLTGNDNSSGILKIEYSLDNGQTVQTYKGPFIISTPGKITIQFKAIDKLGNEEIPQTITIEIAVPPTPTPTPTPTSTTTITETNSSDNSNSPSVTTTSSTVILGSKATPESNLFSSSPAVLGVEFKNPSHISDISDEINTSHLLDQQTNSNSNNITNQSPIQTLGGLLIIYGGIILLASFGLIAAFLKQFPK